MIIIVNKHLYINKNDIYSRGYLEMRSNKRLTTVTATVLIIMGLLVSLTPMKPLQADSVSGETTFYFVDMFDENLPRESSYGMLPLISTVPPTKSNDSFYPPKLLDGFTLNVDENTLWFTYWTLTLFEGMDGFEDIAGDLSDLLDGLKLLMPNPLAIVEPYEYQGNDTINISGDISFNIYTYSKLATKIQKNDQVKVSVYALNPNSMLPFPAEIANKTINTSSGFFKNIVPQTVTLTNVNYKLQPDTSLFFSIEILPGAKTLTSMLQDNNSFLKTNSGKILDFIKKVADRTNNSELDNLLFFVDMVQNLSEELNISSQQIAEVVDSMISTSFVYASQAHPASVTVPFIAGNGEKEDFLSYYLHVDKTMDATLPTSSESTTLSLADGSVTWQGPVLTRNKLLSNVSALLYIEHTDYRMFKDPLTVEVTLLSNGKELEKSTQVLSKTISLSSSLNAYRFTFENLSDATELTYGTKLGLKIGLSGSTNDSSIFGRKVLLHYDSQQHLSSLSFRFSETDHLSVTGVSNPPDGKIIPGDTVTYTLNVTSELSDTVSISIRDASFSPSEQKQWSVNISPASFSIADNGGKSVTVKITSLNQTLGAYDAEPLKITLDVIGLTGFASYDVSAEVSEDAVIYDFIIIVPEGKEIIHGTNETYQFEVINNNTGIFPDGYIFTATSDHFDVTVDPLTINDVAFNETVLVNVTVHVADKTEIKKDALTFTVISKGNGLNKSAGINSTIIGANIFEDIYDYFDSLGSQLGLSDTFGSFAAYLLIAILIIVLFFILILVVFILTTKFAVILCSERIKEILPTEHAQYTITIKNPTRKARSYLVDVELSENGDKWKAVLDKTHLQILPQQSQTVNVTISATDAIDAEDWTQATVSVVPEGRKTRYSLDLLTSVKDGAVDLSIDDVFHWPRRFDASQKVQTSLKLRNNGYIQAKNVKVSLYINGEEKNKVEDVVIPAGGYADITLPWIAEKGKNDLQIIVS